MNLSTLVKSGPTTTLSFSNWSKGVQLVDAKFKVYCRPFMRHILVVEDCPFRTLCGVRRLKCVGFTVVMEGLHSNLDPQR